MIIVRQHFGPDVACFEFISSVTPSGSTQKHLQAISFLSYEGGFLSIEQLLEESLQEGGGEGLEIARSHDAAFRMQLLELFANLCDVVTIKGWLLEAL